MAGLEDLYREIILDHYRAPRNRGELPVPPAHKVEGFNPLCGDEVVLYLDIDGGLVADVRTEGQGCSISQASTSMMSAAIKGKPVDEVRRLIRAFKSLMSIHESKLEGGDDGRGRLGARGRPDGGPRGAPGRGEVPGAHQVRHARLEHPPAGPRRRRPGGGCGHARLRRAVSHDRGRGERPSQVRRRDAEVKSPGNASRKRQPETSVTTERNVGPVGCAKEMTSGCPPGDECQ